jgi:hypothetical protein
MSISFTQLLSTKRAYDLAGVPVEEIKQGGWDF